MGEVFAFMAMFGYGFSAVLIKKGTMSNNGQSNSAANGAFLSMLLTFLMTGFIWVILFILSDRPPINTAGIICFFIAGVLSVFIGRTFLYAAIDYLGSVRVSAVEKLSPFFTIIIAVVILNEPITTAIVLGGLCIFIGLSLMFLQNIQMQVEQGVTLQKKKEKQEKPSVVRKLTHIGYCFGIIASLSYAFGHTFRKEGLIHLPDPFLGTALGALVGILLYLIFAIFNKKYRDTVISTFTTFNLWLFLAGISLSFGQTMLFVAINYTEVSRVVLIISAETIVTICASIWIFKTKEGITRLTIFAALLMLVGAISILVMT